MSGLPSPPDIVAMLDVLQDLIDGVDDLDKERAATLHQALLDLQDKAKEAREAVETKLMELAEQPIAVGNKAYMRQLGSKQRTAHGYIRQQVVALASAADKETGELPSSRDAARAAALMMADIYVAPATKAKTGALEALGIDTKPAFTYVDDDSEHLEIIALRRPE